MLIDIDIDMLPRPLILICYRGLWYWYWYVTEAFEDVTSASSLPVHVIKAQESGVNPYIGPWISKIK